jgi:hypothetical protein
MYVCMYVFFFFLNDEKVLPEWKIARVYVYICTHNFLTGQVEVFMELNFMSYQLI